MTDTEILKIYEELVEIYGDDLPNFENEPKQFAYILKLHLYYGRQAV